MSVIVRVPVRVPLAVGVKVTLIVQLPLTANEAPQLLVWAKSPLVAMLVMVSAAVPLLVSVTVCAAEVVPTFWPAKVRLAGESPAAGAMPVPLKLAVCGLPAALSVTVNVPLRAPEAVGAKLTLIVQLPPTAKEEPQLFVWVKSPLVAILVMESAAVPLLDKVTVCAALLVPTLWLAKLRLTGVRLATGAAVTVSVTWAV